MERSTRVAVRVLLGSAGLALVLGLVIWVGDVHSLIDTHQLAGYALIASLWALAFIAARSRVPFPVVAAAAAWGALVLGLGWGQRYLLTGSWHWVVQVVHVVISMASVPWGKRLASLIRRSERAGVVPIATGPAARIVAR